MANPASAEIATPLLLQYAILFGMGWDFAAETVRVLTEGLPDPPAVPTPGVTFAAAVHHGDHFGAVLWLRLWHNGEWDSDTAITERDDESWTWPSACGGGGWIDPYERPDGWDGEAILVMGVNQQAAEAEDGSLRHATAVEGMAARRVKSILCTTATEKFTYSVDSPLGAFVVVVEGAERPTLTPLDSAQRPLG